MIPTQQFTQQGWECPKCKKIYSPSTPMCFTCPQQSVVSTATNPQLTYPVGTHTITYPANGTIKGAVDMSGITATISGTTLDKCTDTEG